MTLVILDDESAKSEPLAAEVKRSQEIMYSGIIMTDYVFLEPSTTEGEIREIRFYHNGLSYQLRFSFGPGVDQDQLDWILRNLELIQ